MTDIEKQRELERLLLARGSGTRDLDTQIAALATELGLDPSEVAGDDFAAALAEESQPLVGEFEISSGLFGRGVNRLRFDEQGRLELPGHGLIDGPQLARIDLAFRTASLGSAIERAASETCDLTLVLRDGTAFELARGKLWRVSPKQQISYVHLARRLEQLARAGGLAIEQRPDGFLAKV